MGVLLPTGDGAKASNFGSCMGDGITEPPPAIIIPTCGLNLNQKFKPSVKFSYSETPEHANTLLGYFARHIRVSNKRAGFS